MDKIVRAVAGGDFAKISVITARDMAERARQIHHLSPTACAVLGRTLCAASMLGDMMKEDDASVTVRIDGGGPIGSVIAVSDSRGNARGYVDRPQTELPLRADGKLDVGGAVGKSGTLTVSRDIGLREPYVGSVQLVSGEIAEDLTKYFLESEQIPAACGLGVLVDTDRSVKAAGGFIVQLLPGAPDSLAEKIEENISRMGPLTSLLDSGGTEGVVAEVFSGLGARTLGEAPVEYRCYCSRERVTEALAGIGADSLHSLADGGEDTEVSCQFCDAKYVFTPDELLGLAAGAGGGNAEN